MKTKKQQSRSAIVGQRVTELQKAVQKQVEKGLERGMELLPPAWRKTVKRYTNEVDRTRRELRKRGERVAVNARKTAEDLVGQAEKAVAGALEPMTRRLDLPTRGEVERLRKRLEQVERRLHSQAGQSSAVA